MNIDINQVYNFINNLPPFPSLNYDPLNVDIYQILDIQKITHYMGSNWKLFITNNDDDIRNMRIHMYSVCNTFSVTVINHIINVLYQSLKDCFDLYGPIDIEEKILEKYLEINLETLIYKKTNNSYNPYRYI